jgi:hypothetical protein
VALDGLNVVTILRSPGPIVDGNLSIAVYLDEGADERQRETLQMIFAGAAGGPMGGLAPLISSVLGTKTMPITFRKEGKRRAVEIPGVMQIAVDAVPGADSQKEISLINVHPFAPEGLTVAIGDAGSTWADYGMRWDNSGKNGLYAKIRWSNG